MFCPASRVHRFRIILTTSRGPKSLGPASTTHRWNISQLLFHPITGSDCEFEFSTKLVVNYWSSNAEYLPCLESMEELRVMCQKISRNGHFDPDSASSSANSSEKSTKGFHDNNCLVPIRLLLPFQRVCFQVLLHVSFINYSWNNYWPRLGCNMRNNQTFDGSNQSQAR